MIFRLSTVLKSLTPRAVLSFEIARRRISPLGRFRGLRTAVIDGRYEKRTSVGVPDEPSA
jgi:hypothetical protein